MRTALVTGVVGQDGAYLSRHLLRAGYRVIGTTTAAGARADFEAAYLAGVHLRSVDLTDALGMRALLEAERPDEIYNLAAVSSVSASWDNPLKVSQVNGIAVLSLLETLRALRTEDGYSPRVCQASSAEVFGTPVSLPQDEGHRVLPTNPYAVAKAFAQFSAANYRDAHGMFVSSVILFNHESPLRPAHFVTRKITSAAVEIAAGKREVLELGRLDIRRDWGFAGDHVEVMHAALQADRPGDFCVATGRSHSLLEFASMAFEAAGVEDFDRIRSNPAFVRPTDIPEMVGSTDRARAELGWAPVTPLAEVVARMVAVDGRRMVTGVEHHPDYL